MIFNKSGKHFFKSFVGDREIQRMSKYTYLGIETAATGNVTAALSQL